MKWLKIKKLFIILSVSFSIPFLAVYLCYAVSPFFNCRIGSNKVNKTSNGLFPMIGQLGLTEDQQMERQSLWNEFKTKSDELRKEINALRGQMIDLMSATETDRQAIEAKQEEILSAQEKMQTLVIENLLAEKEILTPEQQKKVFDMIRTRCGCGRHGLSFGYSGLEGCGQGALGFNSVGCCYANSEEEDKSSAARNSCPYSQSCPQSHVCGAR